MRKTFLLILLFACTVMRAQVPAVDKYAQIPTELEAAFVDHVKDYKSGVARTAQGHYFGQITDDQGIYGFGSYFTEQDGVSYGQYRNGEFIFGIKMGLHTASVGNNEHFICYDLTNGEPLYICKNGQKYDLPVDVKSTYRFESLTYQNGDKYVGETVNGMRDGLGLYYYDNGNYYYGRYKANSRKGMGALFHTSNIITVMYIDEE